MHPRQRSPRGFYASEYRNRGGGVVGGGGGGGDGFGRGYNNRRGSVSAVNVSAATVSGGGGGGDVFVEAGRLAAEYLVFQGLLPPSVLSLKVYNQNGSFKKHVGVSSIGVGGVGVGGGLGEILVDGGRSSVLARLGNNAVAGVDGGFTGRGKLGIEEFGQKGRRRGSFKSNGFDLGNREYRRNGSWSGRFLGGSDIRDDDDDDVVVGIGIGIGIGSGSGVRQQDEEEPRIQQVEVEGEGEGEVVVVGGDGGGSGGDVDTLMEKSNLNEFVPTSEDGNDLEAEANKNQASVVSDGELLELKQDSSVEGKDAGDMDVEFVGSSNDLENMSIDKVKEVVKDGAGSSGDDGDKPSISKNSSAQSSDQENDSSGVVFTDLLLLCKSVKVPTKTRSSLTNKNLKAFPVANNAEVVKIAEENVHEIMDVQEPGVLAENEPIIDSSSGNLLSDKTYDIVHIDSDAGEEPVHSVEDMKELDTACEAEEDQSVGSQSDKDQEFTAELPEFGGCSSVPEERGEKRVSEEDVDVREDTKRLREWQPLPSPIPKTEAYFLHNTPIEVKELPEFGGCSSMSEERGEKRVAEDVDVREDTKRLREWQPLPSPIPKTEAYFLHNTPIEVKDSPEEHVISVSHVDKMSLTSDQGNLMSSSQFPDEGDRPFFQCSEARPPLPSSFRTCDLNLIETSEVHDNHIDHPVLIYSPTVSDTKETVPVDNDLSMSHASVVDNDLSMSHASVSGKFNTHGANGKEIEVIDLENDSIQEEKAIDSIDRKTDTLFTGLDGFSSHAQNAADINDVQDGYGLMISELLGTDFANCSSVSDDINAVHNEIGLDNGTGTLAEDDSIYMSLGELSFLRPWEQPPPQDYQKF